MTDEFHMGPTTNFLGTMVTAVSTGHGHSPRQPEETFEQWLQKNAREFPVALQLPPDLSVWISKIVTYWAVAEWIQLGTLAILLRIERKEARVMFGARIGNAVSKIRQLIDMRNIKVSIDLDELSQSLTECERARNLLGHGVWMIDSITLTFCIENPSGEWIEKKEASVSKRKYPQAFHPTKTWFAATLKDIETAILELQRLDGEIAAALTASSGKRE